MRIGANPARRLIPAYTPHRLGVASLVYVPELSGYFADMLPVIELHLHSLRQNTCEVFDLLVLDNGSCLEVKDRLLDYQKEGLIDWLITSRHNLGKTGALNWMFSAMPNELLAYSDCDVLFRPGWLEQSLAILEAFPQSGMITAQPDFLPLVDGSMKAHEQMDPAEYEFGDYFPPQATIDEYVLGLGNHPRTRERLAGKPVRLATRRSNGVQAVIGATHMQFLARKAVLAMTLPLPATLGMSPEEDQVLDKRVDDHGFLHLSTLAPYVYHMGNQVDETAIAAKIAIGQVTPPTSGSPALEGWPVGWRFLAGLAQKSFLRGFFRKLYNRLFQIYSQ